MGMEIHFCYTKQILHFNQSSQKGFENFHVRLNGKKIKKKIFCMGFLSFNFRPQHIYHIIQ